jgi:hypothetical protein
MERKSRKSKKPGKSPKFEVSESPDYKVMYASGVFGGLDPQDGRIIFFLDRIKPKMKKSPRGAMELEKVNRELQVEIHMSPPQFMSVAKWMMDHAKRFGDKIKKSRKGESSDASGTSYIG